MKRFSALLAAAAVMVTMAMCLMPSGASATPYDVIWGNGSCIGNSIGVTFPTVGDSGVGTVWATNVLWARYRNGGRWAKVGTGQYWWNNSNRSVFDWYNKKTGNVDGATDTMFSEGIKSGYEAGIYQFVEIHRRWYRSPFMTCNF